MSRSIENINIWKQQLESSGQRGVAFISADIPQLKPAFAANCYNILKVDLESGLATESQKNSQLLGQEFDIIELDLRHHFDPNQFCALVGTLKAGGAMLIKLPRSYSSLLAQAANEQAVSINYAQSLAFDSKHKKPSSQPVNFSHLLTKLFENYTQAQIVAFIHPAKSLFKFPQPGKVEGFKANYREQALVVEKIIKVATGRNKRPLVITADRGRGKTAALALACKSLVQSSEKNIIITAPSKTNLISFDKHFQLEKSPSQLNSSVQFMAIDQIIETWPKADLVIIDEAAAIPTQQLLLISKHYQRLVFATTEHGYEGNGKGFQIRFKQQLLSIYPQTNFSHLNAPLRWREDDVLESLVFKTMLFATPLAKLSDTRIQVEDEIKYRSITSAMLLNDEHLLSQCFVLLLNAHYQTKPSDLEQLLSSSHLQIHLLENKNQQVIAVALCVLEGALSPHHTTLCLQGRKPIAGELLPQSIIAHQGFGQAGNFRYLRVMRIATHPSVQNRGFGKKLLNALEQNVHATPLNFVGASFACDAKTLNFWQSSGYQVIRLTSTKDAASGQQSVEVLKLNNNRSSEALTLFNQLTSRCLESFEHKLTSEFKSICPSIIATLFANAQKVQTIDQHELLEAQAFCQGYRGFTMVDWILKKLLIKTLTDLTDLTDLDNNLKIKIRLLLNGWSAKQVIQEFSLLGKKQLITQLRQSYLPIITKLL
ncbi:GNAT family N-acetyltransferase [Aliikangiella sp. IMCC44632]